MNKKVVLKSPLSKKNRSVANDSPTIRVGGAWKKQFEELDRWKSKCNDLESENNKLKAILGEQSESLTKQSILTQEMDATNKTLQEKVQNYEKELTLLTEKLHAKQIQHSTLSEQFRNTRESIQNQNSTLLEDKELINALENQIDMKNKNLCETETELSLVKSQLEMMTIKQEKLNDQYNIQSKTLNLTTKVKDQKDNHLALVLKEKERLHRIVAQLRSTLKKHNIKDSVEQPSSVARSPLPKSARSPTKQSPMKSSPLKSPLKNSLSTPRLSKGDQIRSRLMSAEKLVDNLKEENNTLQKEVQLLSSEKFDLLNRFREAMRQVESLKRKCF
eukprot:TRINITY_DN774285_c0_g1_i1.p1 TRINITY_DN774285_c0_g1~~TRINITY_DN774285_c0_g1_i1.p1  ORF type:complete len:332 (+),score=81.06 TRINITY_DN774285_c0_g1_i1:81-1076(+)